jgi:hypothetical protein
MPKSDILNHGNGSTTEVLRTIPLDGEGGRRYLQLTDTALETGDHLVCVDIVDQIDNVRLSLLPRDAQELAAVLWQLGREGCEAMH